MSGVTIPRPLPSWLRKGHLDLILSDYQLKSFFFPTQCLCLFRSCHDYLAALRSRSFRHEVPAYQTIRQHVSADLIWLQIIWSLYNMTHNWQVFVWISTSVRCTVRLLAHPSAQNKHIAVSVIRIGAPFGTWNARNIVCFWNSLFSGYRLFLFYRSKVKISTDHITYR